jgi:hypothetical protein
MSAHLKPQEAINEGLKKPSERDLVLYYGYGLRRLGWRMKPFWSTGCGFQAGSNHMPTSFVPAAGWSAPSRFGREAGSSRFKHLPDRFTLKLY